VAEGIRAVAAPVFDHEIIAGTIAFVGTLSSIPADPNSGLAEALKNATQKLSCDLGRGRENSARGATA
jgi:DNA-binding IclR family transcriptional regulator